MDFTIQSPIAAVAVIGLGGLVIGLLRLLMAARQGCWRANVWDGLLVAAWGTSAAGFGLPAFFWGPAYILAAALIAPLTWRSQVIQRICVRSITVSTHPGFLACAIAGMGFGIVIWIVEAHQPDLESNAWLQKIEDTPLEEFQDEEAASIAYTDAHSPVFLFRPKDQSAESVKKLAAQEKSMMARWFSPPRVLQLQPADGAANCYGWIFTKDKYILRGRDVPQILHENGYYPVKVPQLGDLVAYSNPSGAFVHMGVIHSLRPGGQGIVESKWGKMGRYLHLPKDQPYSAQFVYYHSPRQGHLLVGLESPESAAQAGSNRGLVHGAD